MKSFNRFASATVLAILISQTFRSRRTAAAYFATRRSNANPAILEVGLWFGVVVWGDLLLVVYEQNHGHARSELRVVL